MLQTSMKVIINNACPSGDWCPPKWAYHTDPATSQAEDHIQDCNNDFQLCSWYVPDVFLCGLYARSDSCQTCQATLCVRRSPRCSGYENEYIWQSQRSLCCSYCLEQFTFLPSRHQHKLRAMFKWTKNLVVCMCLHVGGATENIIVAALHKCADWLID